MTPKYTEHQELKESIHQRLRHFRDKLPVVDRVKEFDKAAARLRETIAEDLKSDPDDFVREVYDYLTSIHRAKVVLEMEGYIPAASK